MILVTGATGFIGQRLIVWLANEQYPICCLVHPSGREQRFAPGVSLQIVAGDINDPPALRLAMHNVSTVVHLAGLKNETRTQTFEAVNVQGTHNVVEAMREVGVDRLVTISPIGADGHSAYAYLRSKAQVEDIVRSSGLDYTILQTSVVYGPGDDWTETIALALRRIPFFFPIAGNGRSRSQPIFIEDLINCLGYCLTEPRTFNQTYTFGGPQHLTFEEVVQLIMQATGRRRTLRYVSLSTARSLTAMFKGLLRGRLLYSETDLDLLAIDRTTALDSVAYQFGLTPARMANALDYLKPRPKRRA
jgi:uncharacterized protein YbjT (DUF2867 family)